ncbi:MAG: hypothetical protein RLZZ210_501 [Pseudomonadota bacterium]|jgi:hypothetical protein
MLECLINIIINNDLHNMNNIIKKTGLILGMLAGLSSASAVYAHGDKPFVGISLAGDIAPGVYGKININSHQPPPVIYSRPVIVERPVTYYSREPVYMYVPSGHYRHWARNCHKYNACDRNVYFVNPSYVDREYRESRYERDARDNRRDGIREVNYTHVEYNNYEKPRHHRHHGHHHGWDRRDDDRRDRDGWQGRGRWGGREDY